MGNQENLKRENEEFPDHPDLDPETGGAFVLSKDGKIVEIEPKKPKQFYGGQQDKSEIIFAQKSSIREQMEHLFLDISAAIRSKAYLEKKLNDLKGRFEEICQKLYENRRGVTKMNKEKKKKTEEEKLRLMSQLKSIVETEIPIKEAQVGNLIDNLNKILERIDREIEQDQR